MRYEKFFENYTSAGRQGGRLFGTLGYHHGISWQEACNSQAEAESEKLSIFWRVSIAQQHLNTCLHVLGRQERPSDCQKERQETPAIKYNILKYLLIINPEPRELMLVIERVY